MFYNFYVWYNVVNIKFYKECLMVRVFNVVGVYFNIESMC